jgi:hypothetical protein
MNMTADIRKSNKLQIMNYADWPRGNALGIHSISARFGYQPGHWLSLLMVFVVFLSPSRQMSRYS